MGGVFVCLSECVCVCVPVFQACIFKSVGVHVRACVCVCVRASLCVFCVRLRVCVCVV